MIEGYSDAEIQELKGYCDRLRFLPENGVPYFRLDGLRLPDGCEPKACDALLCPVMQQTYPSRLFFSKSISGRFTRNWNLSNHSILNENWHAFSWMVPVGLSLPELLREHLSGFTRMQ